MWLDAGKLRRTRQLLWLLLVLSTSVFLSLSFLSASNYTDITIAKLGVDAETSVMMSVSGLGPSNEVLNVTTFWFNATVNMSNPSSRSVRLQFMNFRSSIRDYVLEDYINQTTSFFTPIVLRNVSYPANEGLIGPGDVRTYRMSWKFSLGTDTIYFERARDVMNYALNRYSIPWDDVEWFHLFVIQLIVTDVPIDYYGPNSGYLIELPVIRLDRGFIVGTSQGRG